ncbi:MAG: haloacid dehalogenase-like hydrolase [Thermoplasmata archaeon]|nr:haloacid dehalogenase-like hydrolase [Thermoplasmata archaeon]
MPRRRASRPRWRLVTIDIDGTLTTVHGWRFLAEQRGWGALWRQSTARYLRRETNEDEHLRDLLGLAEGLDRASLYEILEATPKIAGIGEAVAAWHADGTKVALLTHNPPYIVAWWKKRFGFDAADGVRRAPGFRRGRVGAAGAVVADKAGGLHRLLRKLTIDAAATVHIGDGWADAELFPLVGAGVALNSRLREVERAADLVRHHHDLRPMVPALQKLRPRRR